MNYPKYPDFCKCQGLGMWSENVEPNMSLLSAPTTFSQNERKCLDVGKNRKIILENIEILSSLTTSITNTWINNRIKSDGYKISSKFQLNNSTFV